METVVILRTLRTLFAITLLVCGVIFMVTKGRPSLIVAIAVLCAIETVLCLVTDQPVLAVIFAFGTGMWVNNLKDK